MAKLVFMYVYVVFDYHDLIEIHVHEQGAKDAVAKAREQYEGMTWHYERVEVKHP